MPRVKDGFPWQVEGNVFVHFSSIADAQVILLFACFDINIYVFESFLLF